MEIKILVIEDDPTIAKVIVDGARALGATVEHAADGESGLKSATESEFAVVVLDIGLPGMNGFDVCRRLRENNKAVTILMVTSHGDEIDRVLGLELGADDYVTKPFSIRELTARIRVLIRRFEQIAGLSEAKAKNENPSSLTFGALEIHLKRKEAYFAKRRLELTALEFEILAFLALRAGEATTRDEMMRAVWGYECSQFDSTVTTHLSRLRYKVEPEPDRPRFILTVKGVGYRFVTNEELEATQTRSPETH